METAIAREMREFLRQHRMSIRALARLAGVSHNTLSRILNGTRRDMTATSADAVRSAMARYQTYRQSGGES